MTESIDWNDGYDEPQQPRSGLWQRLRRTRSRTVGTDATCRPVSVLGADDDTRAVRALTQAASRMLGTWAEANDELRRELWTTLHDRADDVHDRFRERYAALDAKVGK